MQIMALVTECRQSITTKHDVVAQHHRKNRRRYRCNSSAHAEDALAHRSGARDEPLALLAAF